MSTDGSAGEFASEPRLRSLRPKYEATKHQLYVSLLLRDISSQEPSRNIAVSGAYGSGKSSVLEGLLAELDKQHKPIAVALATLNQSKRNLVHDSGEKDLTSALEKEVVKRLIYSTDPSKLPRSRFTRIASFRLWMAVKIAALISALVIGFTFVMGVSLPMSPFGWSGWRETLVDFLLLAVLVLGVQYAFSTVRISQVRLGPAEVSLDYRTGNYFDHYLDEIIYFFRRTKTDIVIFEDLDRFDDPGIFLALRELNSLLNNSSELAQHVVFVYAIRDSLFAEVIGSEGQGEPPVEATMSQGRLNNMQSAASDRAKFFDLVVPIVPFISHEVSADLLLSSLEDLPGEQRPSRELVTLVGKHFTDMRVLLSVRNEYQVFAKELLGDSAVMGLSYDGLFAVVAYKHSWLDDFERIQTGESNLDKAISDIESARLKMIEQVDTEIARTQNAIHTGEAVDRSAQKAGDQLLAFLDLSLRLLGRGPVTTLAIGDSNTLDRAEVTTAAFWKALAAQETPTLAVKAPGAAIELTSEDLSLALGDYGDIRAWTRFQPDEDRRQVHRLIKARDWLVTATLRQLLTEPSPPIVDINESVWRLMSDGCARTLGGRGGLAFSLLSEGYLDRNFALYTTKFYGRILSANARSYMMQYVDRHQSDPLFELTPVDVDEILDRAGDGLLADASSLNVHIVDRLLEPKHRRIPVPLETSGQATEFLITYLRQGASGTQLLKRVTAKRADILDVVANASRLSEVEQREYLSTCLASLASEIDYGVSEATRAVLARHLDAMSVLGQDIEPEAAASIADLLKRIALDVADLSQVAEPLRGNLASAGRFPITRANLEALAGPSGTVGLDSLGKRYDGLDSHLITYMSDYLVALSYPRAAIVDASENLDAVVREILESNPGTLAKALAFLPEGAMYDELVLAPMPAYPALAQVGAFAATRANVTQYVSAVGSLDEALGQYLNRAGRIAVSDGNTDSDEQAARQQIAAAVVSSEWIDNDTKLSLITSLGTSDFLDLASVDRLEDPELAAGLLAAGEISDSPESFAVLAKGPWEVFEACATRSSNLGTFVDRLPLNDALLAQIFTSKSIDAEVKMALLAHLEAFEPVLSEPGATAASRAATGLGIGLSGRQYLALAEAGARTSPLLDAVSLGLPNLTTQDLIGILSHCEHPFSDLVSGGGEDVVIPGGETLRPLLEKLEASGVVRYLRKKRGQQAFQVKPVP